jgi:hypothetical protein
LIEQLGNFQNACRDVARRTGLVPFVANPGDPFDQNFHQLADPNVQVQMDSKVEEVIATGYTFQGQLLRPALVTLQTQIFEQVPPAMEEAPVIAEIPVLEQAAATTPEIVVVEEGPVVEEVADISIKELLQRKEPAEPEMVARPANAKLEEQTLL